MLSLNLRAFLPDGGAFPRAMISVIKTLPGSADLIAVSAATGWVHRLSIAEGSTFEMAPLVLPENAAYTAYVRDAAIVRTTPGEGSFVILAGGQDGQGRMQPSCGSTGLAW